jgi:hypothetical protein
MNPKALLVFAMARLTPNELNVLLERTGLRWQVDQLWYEYKDGALREVGTGSPASGTHIREVKLETIMDEGVVKQGGPRASEGVKERAGGTTIKDGDAVGQGAKPTGAPTVGGSQVEAPEPVAAHPKEPVKKP